MRPNVISDKLELSQRTAFEHILSGARSKMQRLLNVAFKNKYLMDFIYIEYSSDQHLISVWIKP